MTTDTLRQVFGTLRTPNGTAFPNKSLKWFRERRATVAQGSSVVLDDPFIVTTDAQGDIDTAVMAGAYLVMAPLSDADRYFRVVVPDQAGPLDISSLIDGPMVEPDDLTQFEALVAKAKAWANAPEDSVVESGEFSAKHYAAKAEEERLGAQSAVDLAVAAALAKAEEWADNPEDVEVEAGQYSAKHWAAKSAEERIASEIARTGAELAETNAEAARDAAEVYASGAAVTAGFYDTISLGRVAVADGETFGVFAGGSDGLARPSIYRRNSSSTQTLIAEIVAPTEVDRLSLFPGRSLAGVTAAELAAFSTVKKLEFSGVPEGKVMILKFLFWKDVGTRFNMTFQVADDISGTNAVDACAFSLADGQGAGSWTGFKDIELAEVSASGIRASATLDLTGVSSLAAYNPTTAAMFQRRQVNLSCHLGGVASEAEFAANLSAPNGTSVVSNIVTGILDLAPGSRMPFADAMTNDTLREIVRDIQVFNAPDRSPRYVISQFNVEQFAGTPLTRVLVDLRDTVLGATVARYSFSTASAPSFADFWATVPEVLRLDDFALPPSPNSTRIIAFLQIDKSAVTDWMVHSTSTVAGGGVHADQSFPDAMQADYLEDDRAHEVIPVGAGQTFTTLRAAVESLYGDGSTINSYRRGRAHYNRRQRVELIDDADYAATYLDFPEFVELVGQGPDRTRIVKENDDTDAMLEMHLAGKIHNLTIYSDTGDGAAWLGEYCAHWDDFNRRAGGGKAQNLRIRKSMKNVNLIGGPNQKTWLLGTGISSGEHWLLENVHAWHEADLTGASGIPAAFGIHNTGPRASQPQILTSYKPSIVQMRGCSSRDMTMFPLYVQTLAAGARCILDLQDCSFHCVRQDVAIDLDAPLAAQPDLARDRFAWAIGGRHDGAILQYDPQGLIVLQTTPGVAVSGDAAALIFGDVDNLGRGEKWVKNGSTHRSLGARLGDCSSVNKTLTIGAQSVTFTTDLTAETNTAILAIINAAISSNPVSEVDIQFELYPDTGTLRWVQNSTGATIPRGVFVRFTGQDTIAVCGAGERPDGWTFRAIPNGAMGAISLGRKIATQYLTNAASSTGEWGITTAGTLDYAAGTKLGRTIGGVVSVF